MGEWTKVEWDGSWRTDIAGGTVGVYAHAHGSARGIPAVAELTVMCRGQDVSTTTIPAHVVMDTLPALLAPYIEAAERFEEWGRPSERWSVDADDEWRVAEHWHVPPIADQWWTFHADGRHAQGYPSAFAAMQAADLADGVPMVLAPIPEVS